AKDAASAGHVVELYHALGDVEGMMIGQRHHAGAEHDALGALAGGGQKHLRRGDGFPAARMMLAAPELVIAERIELLDQIEIPAKLQHRMLADRVMRGEEGSEFEARHGCLSEPGYCCCLAGRLRAGRRQGNRGKAAMKHGSPARPAVMPRPGISWAGLVECSPRRRV